MSPEYKLALLQQIDRLKGQVHIGEFLRQEGLYYSTISQWRRLHRQKKLGTTPRGRKKKSREALSRENQALRRQLQQLEREVERSRAMVELHRGFFRPRDFERPPLTPSRMALIQKAGHIVGLGKACDTLGLSRATFYRNR